MRQLATILRHIFATENATLRPFSHSGHTEWVIKTCCTIITRIIGKLELGFASSSHTCCTTFARYSRRETLVRCSQNEIASIYHQRPSHEVLANVVRLSLEGRITVARWFCKKTINREKIKKNIPII